MGKRITRHSAQRLIERDDSVDTTLQAKRTAKIARVSGKTIGCYQRYPKFFSYLQNKKGQTNTCSIRIYQDNIYIWRGKSHSLVTAHPIPERYKAEMEEIDRELS